MTEILAATDTVTTLVADVFSIMTSNPYLVVFFAVGLLSIGIGVFTRLRNAARG